MNQLTSDKLRAYLFCGYGRFNDQLITELQPVNITSDFSRNINGNISTINLHEEINDRFLRSIKQSLDANFGKKHIVPLSGGLDSRFILAYLGRFVPPSEIFTFTFGIPNSLDFEIGNLIAKEYGTNHISIDLTDEKNLKEIKNSMDFSVGFTNMNSLPPISVLNNFVNLDESLYWSGYMGDPLFGSHWPQVGQLQFQDYLIKKEKNGIDFRGLPEFREACIDSFKREFDVDAVSSSVECERWDLSYRQKYYVVPQIFFKGIEYATPFLSYEMLQLAGMLGISDLNKSRLYHSFLSESDPLFKLPTKTYLGDPIALSSYKKIRYKFKKFIFGRSKGLRKKMLTNYYGNLDFHKANLKTDYLEALDLLIDTRIGPTGAFEKAYLNYDKTFENDSSLYGLCLGLSHGIRNA